VGSVSAPAVQRAGTVLGGAGSVSATGGQHGAVTKGSSTAYGVTAPAVSSASVAEVAGCSASVTGRAASASVTELAGCSASVTAGAASSSGVS
jgi:hypothetical protein